MISIEEARTRIAQHIVPLAPQRRPLGAARGRVLAEEVIAEADMPPFDRSAVDGYAVGPGEDWRVVMQIAAGALPSRDLRGGECARVLTGAALPVGTERVLMQEQVRMEDGKVRAEVAGGVTHIRQRGEDARTGDLLLRAGQRLGALALALLAQLGRVEPLIRPAPRILHCVTGDELVAPEAVPGPGQIRDSNSTLMAALAAEAGAEIIGQTRTGDSIAALVDPAQSRSDWDVLLISGGASVGEHDYSRRALEALGFTVHFHQLNLRPGKPLIFATRASQCAFAIPGNPLSHFVCWQVIIRRALERLEGAADLGRETWLPVLAEAPLPRNARETWWPARLAGATEGGIFGVRPLPWQSSGDITRLLGVDALIRVPAGESIGPGAGALCLRLDSRG